MRLSVISIVLILFLIVPVSATIVYTNYVPETHYVYCTTIFMNDSYYLRDGSLMLTGRMDGGGYNLSNITSVAEMDAVNRSVLNAAIAGITSGGGLSDAWNSSYYLLDTSRALTGSNVHRDVNNDVLVVHGGTSGLPYGGHLQLYGGDNVAMSGGAIFSVGDAAGTGSSIVWSVLGTTDDPELSMSNNKIIDLADPTNNQDAVTLAYYNAHMGGVDVTGLYANDTAFAANFSLFFVPYSNSSYYLTDNSRTLTTEKVRRDVDNDLLSLYGGNAIAGGTGGILSLFGKDTINPNAVEIGVGDGGVGNTLVTGWVAGANPRMDMNGFNISSLLDPVATQDAATMNWVLVQIGNTTASSDPGLYANDTALFANDTAHAANETALFGNSTLAFLKDGSRAATGWFDMALNQINNVITGSAGGSATNRTFVESLYNLILANNTFLKTVSATNPNWDAKGYNLTNLNLTPTSGTDAATMNYVGIQKGNDTAYSTTAYVNSEDAKVKAYTDSNLSRSSSITMSRFFLSNETVFSSVSTTSVYPLGHVLNATTVLIDVICIGGGGGGGGVTGLAANSAGAGGGGAGGYVETWFPVTPSTRVWIGVGGGGPGGAAGANPGQAGKPSNLTVPGGTKWVNCTGGLGGTAMAYGTAFAGVAGGNGGGTVVVGAVSPQWINYGMNQTGMGGYRMSANASIPGSGGSTTLGDGARPPTAAGSGTTCPPGGYGGGGSGALSTAAVSQAGGAGCPGAIIIREYSSGWPAGGAK